MFYPLSKVTGYKAGQVLLNSQTLAKINYRQTLHDVLEKAISDL